MGKKHHKERVVQPQGSQPGLLFDSRARRFFGWGGCCLLLGFFCLTLTDVSGSNWASWFSPVLLLSGYFLIALGLFLPPADPPPPA